MTTDTFQQGAQDYERIALVIEFAQQNFRSQPSLDEMARHACLSKYHFQRLFKRWAGVSPSQFIQYLTLEYAKQQLEASKSILDTSLNVGLSGPSRLHDLFVNFEAVTPGQYRRPSPNLVIHYGFHFTPFGICLVGITDRGICRLTFVDDDGRTDAIDELTADWPDTTLIENETMTADVVRRIFQTSDSDSQLPFHLVVKGTNFQVSVWKALLSIPSGGTVCYETIASYLGRSTATRACANAIAKNPIGYLIPCHRVIAKNGLIHRYRWGATRKKLILAREAALDWATKREPYCSTHVAR